MSLHLLNICRQFFFFSTGTYKAETDAMQCLWELLCWSNSRKIISQCFHLCLSLFPISFLPCNYPFLHLYISIWWQLDYAETGRKMRGWKDIDINNCDLVGNALLCYFHILFILVTSFRKMNTCWLIEQRKKISRNKTSVMHDNQG